jgi:hypothetical protein
MDDSDFDYAEELERLVGEDLYYQRSILKPELYQLSNISLGYAARHMPRLEFVWFYFSWNLDTSLEFVRQEKTGEATLTWTGENGYRPDERVARAWEFDLGGLDSEVIEQKTVSKVTVLRGKDEGG